MFQKEIKNANSTYWRNSSSLSQVHNYLRESKFDEAIIYYIMNSILYNVHT